MFKVYVCTDCTNSKKAEAFLKDNEVIYKRINLTYMPFHEEDLIELDRFNKNSCLELINFNNDYFNHHNLNRKILNSWNLKDLRAFIIANPKILSFPIGLYLDQNNTLKKVVVGFNETEWKHLISDVDERFFVNVNNSYKFKSCCFYDAAASIKDEVLNDDKK